MNGFEKLAVKIVVIVAFIALQGIIRIAGKRRCFSFGTAAGLTCVTSGSVIYMINAIGTRPDLTAINPHLPSVLGTIAVLAHITSLVFVYRVLRQKVWPDFAT